MDLVKQQILELTHHGHYGPECMQSVVYDGLFYGRKEVT